MGYDSSWIRRAIVFVTAVKIFALIVVVDFGQRALNPFDLPKSIVSRALEWLLAGLLVGALARYGPGIVPRTRLHLAVLGVLGASTLSAAAGESRELSFFGDAGRYLGLTFVVDMTVLYFAVACACRSQRDGLVLWIATVLAALLTMGIGFAQAFGFESSRFVADPQHRPIGTVGNPDYLAHLVGVVGAVSIGVALVTRSRLLKTTMLVIALAAGGLATLLAVRGLLIGIAAAAITAAWINRRHLRQLPPWRPSALGVLAVVFLMAALGVTPLGGRVVDTFRGASLRDRLLVWDVALRGASERPLLGYGPDSYAIVFARDRPANTIDVLSTDISADSAHSWVLQAAATTGVVGLAAVTVAMAAFFQRLFALRAARPEVAIPLLLGLALYWAHGIVAVGSISVDWAPYVIYGLVSAAGGWPAEPVAPRRMPDLIALPLLAVAAMFALSGRPALEANSAARAAQSALAVGRVDLASASQAVALDPGRPEYWNELGRTRFTMQDWAGARDAFASATRLASYEPTFWSNLALAENQLAASDASAGAAAIADARRAVSASPNDPLAHLVLAEILVTSSATDALVEAVHTLVLYGMAGSPDADRAVKIIGQTLEGAESGVARRELARAVERRPVADLLLALASADVRGGDATGASSAVRRAIGLDLSNADVRLAGARILRRGGDENAAADLAPPPRLVRIDRNCQAPSGQAVSSDGVVRPLCLQLTFATLDPLRTGEVPGSVTRVEHYSADTKPFPAGTLITYDAEKAVALVLFPAGSFAPPRRAVLRLSDIADIRGRTIAPNSTLADLP